MSLGLAVAARFSFADRKESAATAALELGSSATLESANHYLKQEPVTITAFSSTRSAGGKHDYFSEGDYWWPDPEDLNGPYIQRDGMSNPDNFTQHRHALIRLGAQVPALTAAWVLKKDRRYSDHAARHLRPGSSIPRP